MGRLHIDRLVLWLVILGLALGAVACLAGTVGVFDEMFVPLTFR